MFKLEEQPFDCIHCGKKFMQEKTLFAHMCEPKRRFMQKDEKRVQAGFFAFNRYYRLAQAAKKDKTYEEFCKSSYYNAFVKFGSFVNNVNPLYPDKFIDYVIKSGVKLDHWCRDALYDQYVVDLVRKESVETALERSISHMLSWGNDNNAQWNHYFHYVSLSRATYDIKDGKISPWLVLNSTSGRDMLKKFNDEQLASISSIMDIPFWMNRFKRAPADTDLVKQVIKESNI